MRYLGSKARLFKHIGPIIQQCIDDNHIQTYIEPFAGGMNVIDKIKCNRRIAIDANPHLIAMWRAVQQGWNPPDYYSKEEYKLAKILYKNHKEEYEQDPRPMLGFVGIACAFSGSWFAGYSQSEGRNRCLETKKAVLNQIKFMQDVKFFYADYRYADRCASEQSVIYCDPPYKGIHLYPGSERPFNYDEFWSWAKMMAGKGHIVLVSEYTAPEDITTLLWEQDVSVHAHQTNTKKAKEKLFLVRG